MAAQIQTGHGTGKRCVGTTRRNERLASLLAPADHVLVFPFCRVVCLRTHAYRIRGGRETDDQTTR